MKTTHLLTYSLHCLLQIFTRREIKTAYKLPLDDWSILLLVLWECTISNETRLSLEYERSRQIRMERDQPWQFYDVRNEEGVQLHSGYSET